MPLAAKAGAALTMVAIAETVFHPGSEVGGMLGVFALAMLVAVIATRSVVLRSVPARIALLAAAAYALVLIDDPNPLALLLFAVALSLATLLPQRAFDHALRWVPRLVWHGLTAIARPVRDIAWSSAAGRRRGGTRGPRAIAAMLVLPVVGSVLFLTLFANANPVIGQAFDRVALPDLVTVIWRGLFGGLVFTATWAMLRPRLPHAMFGDTAFDGDRARYDAGLAAIVTSLVAFNAIFAMQNALDVAFLWSGAALPAGVTMAGYAHRGAYALIVAALLAAMFVLGTLRPGSAAANSPMARILVTVWIVQTLLLVASSALRLFDYIEAYSLTTLRLAALLWMALVATGLALILWRLLAGRSAGWLINANALAAALVLSLCSAMDLGATAAAWNARVALRQGRDGPPLDLCHLERLGPSGLIALATLERHAASPVLRDRLAFLRDKALADTEALQGDWRSWSGRNARRLATLRTLADPVRPVLRPAPLGRSCGGSVAFAERSRLTKVAQR